MQPSSIMHTVIMISGCEARGSRDHQPKVPEVPKEVPTKPVLEACSRDLLKQLFYANQWSCRVYSVDNSHVDMREGKEEEKKAPVSCGSSDLPM